MKTTYIPGKWIAICDVCGFRHYSDELQKDWRGLMVCKEDFETKHPQLFIKSKIDNPSVDWVRPETMLFTDGISFVCSLINSQGIAGVGIASCMRAGFKF